MPVSRQYAADEVDSPADRWGRALQWTINLARSCEPHQWREMGLSESVVKLVGINLRVGHPRRGAFMLSLRSAALACFLALVPAASAFAQATDIAGLSLGAPFDVAERETVRSLVPGASAPAVREVTWPSGRTAFTVATWSGTGSALFAVMTDGDGRIVAMIRRFEVPQPRPMAEALREVAAKYGPATVSELSEDLGAHVIHRTVQGALMLGAAARQRREYCEIAASMVADTVVPLGHPITVVPDVIVEDYCGIFVEVLVLRVEGQPASLAGEVQQTVIDLVRFRALQTDPTSRPAPMRL